jgi:DNA-binding MarR family transcriptional regulator
MDSERDGAHEAAVDELTHLVVDQLGPVVVAHRREVARRAGLDPDLLVCLDLLRRLGPLPAGVLAGWTGVTRSAISKLLRRWEDAGHVRRRLRAGQRQVIEVVWRAHRTRDAALDASRARVRRGIAELVSEQRLDDPAKLALVAGVIVRLQTVLHGHTRELTDAAAWADVLEQRRRRRAAAPDPWRGR